MAYCTEADIELQITESDLIELTDDDATGAIVPSVITRAIADADAEIDSHLAVRYALPLTAPYPQIIQRTSVTLAVCWLYSRRPVLDIPKTWQEKCESARKYLEWIALGKYVIDVPDASLVTDSGPRATTTKSDRVFSMSRESDSSTGTLDNY
jgi:phage gp36-like protein